MKKFILLLIILSVLIIQCSNEASGESEKPKSEIEFTEDDTDNFVYEEAETNIIKTNEMKTKIVPKENKKNEVKTETKINETKTNEIKATNENKANENLEIKNSNEIVSENKINETEKIVYIAKTGKKYHLENCRTLRGEKEAIDLNEAIKNGYEVCKVCKPDGI